MVTDTSSEYFPLRVGFYQIYTVDETKYKQGFEPQSLTYQLKTEVVDSFQNNAGGVTYVIYRSTRKSTSDVWKFIDTWSVRWEGRQVIVQEGNTPYLKLLFPAEPGTSWNGNLFNNLEADEYEIKAVGPSQLGNATFNETITIEQEFNDDPIVYTDLRTEVYARNAGLVYKETTQLVFCQNQNCNSNELIESGIEYKQEIIEYGIR
jgi:hypothetical protein